MGKRENRKTTTSGHEPREFKVLIYESEYRQIQAWVSKFQDLETGGDLFGLWSDEPHTAVIQLVLGPGERCRRSGVSFYQDVPYLERVGNHLTGDEGLCHIGEWHSHHTLGLTRPSGGDETTVWSNMPRYGIKRFLLFIATISNGYHYYTRENTGVNVGCFLFEFDASSGKQLPVLPGRFEMIGDRGVLSPFRSKIASELSKGAESVNTDQDLRLVSGNSSCDVASEVNSDPEEVKGEELNSLIPNAIKKDGVTGLADNADLTESDNINVQSWYDWFLSILCCLEKWLCPYNCSSFRSEPTQEEKLEY